MDEKKVLMDEDESKVEKNRKPKKQGKPKGAPKSGGRTAGTPNKKTIYLKDILSASGFEYGKAFSDAFSELPANERMKILLDMVKFIAPELNPKDAPVDTIESGFDQTDILKIVKK